MIFPPTADGQALGMGGAPLGNLFSAIPETVAQALLEHVIGDGCRTFDTAPHYGNGRSEHRFGHALRDRPRASFTLSSKTGRLMRPDASTPREQNSYVDVLRFAPHYDYSFDGTLRSIEDSLQRLGLETLDVAYIHDIDVATHGQRQAAVMRDVLQGAIPALQRLREQGIIKAYGLGVNDSQVCLDVLRHADLDCLMLAGRYSLLDQAGLAELLPLCAGRGTRIALGGVFNSGILATGVRGGGPLRFNYSAADADVIARAGAIEDVCAEFGVPLRAAALQFPLAHEAIEIVMLGVRTKEEWDDARRMMAVTIPAMFWQALLERRLLPPGTPVPSGQQP